MVELIDSTYYDKPAGIPEDVSAGGIIVRKRDGILQVALVRERGTDRYILPKGGIEPGEDPETTARREIIEEAGLSGLALLADLGTMERMNFRKTHWKTIYYFLYRLDDEPGIPTDPFHNFVCDWFSLDHLPPMFWPDQRRLIERTAPRIRQLLADR